MPDLYPERVWVPYFPLLHEPTPSPTRGRVFDLAEAPQRPSSEPIAIEYKRWRRKRYAGERQGYTVEVVEVHHRLGEHGYYTTVFVLNPNGKRVSWPALPFLRAFEPVGRKLRIPTWWERIRRKRDVI